jgi:hypothetical protein
MMVFEKSPQAIRSEFEAELCVDRTDISFHDLPGDRVRIQVTVYNAGRRRSPPTWMRLECAPLGAFVPWEPLTRLPVPALEPGESRELSTGVARSRAIPLGAFDRVPPRSLLTAVSPPDQPPPQVDTGLLTLMKLLRGDRKLPSSGRMPAGRTSLAPDLWDLAGRGQPHWAGNINVFVGTRAVERHLARALRVYPGRTNLAMFLVGGPAKPDAYAFELVGLAPGWEARLYDMSNQGSLVVNPEDTPLEETQWVESDGRLVVMLATQPPAACHTGNLEVHVTRRSSGKTAIVEFDLDADAQGAGCYFV